MDDRQPSTPAPERMKDTRHVVSLTAYRARRAAVAPTPRDSSPTGVFASFQSHASPLSPRQVGHRKRMLQHLAASSRQSSY